MKALIKEFQKENPGITVTAAYADVTPYQAAIRTQMLAGTAADIVYAWPGNGNGGAIDQLAPHGYLAPLDSLSFVSKIPKALAPMSQYKGKTYVLPSSVAGIGMILDQNTMQKYGFSTPTTFSEVLKLCSDAKAKGINAFSLGGQDGWPTIMPPYALVATNVFRVNPNWDQDHEAKKTTFAGSSEYQESYKKFTQLITSGCFQDGSAGESFTNSTQLVAQGKTLGAIQISTVLNGFTAAAPKDKFVLTPLPGNDNASDTWMSAGGSGGVAINAKTKVKALADKFAEFVGSDKGRKIYVDNSGTYPAIEYPGYTPPESVKSIGEFVKSGKVGPLLDQAWPNAEVQQAMIQQNQNLLNGSVTGNDVLKAMDAAYEKGAP